MVISAIPGRIRVDLKNVLKINNCKNTLEENLIDLDGVTEAKVNTKTGRALLLFDLEKTTQQELLKQIQNDIIGDTAKQTTNLHQNTTIDGEISKYALNSVVTNFAVNTLKSELGKLGFGIGIGQKILLNVAMNSVLDSLQPQ
ncbi:MAG: copper chaperone CopZ [bacterium]|jgi:copper chaperone CopZ